MGGGPIYQCNPAKFQCTINNSDLEIEMDAFYLYTVGISSIKDEFRKNHLQDGDDSDSDDAYLHLRNDDGRTKVIVTTSLQLRTEIEWCISNSITMHLTTVQRTEKEKSTTSIPPPILTDKSTTESEGIQQKIMNIFKRKSLERQEELEDRSSMQNIGQQLVESGLQDMLFPAEPVQKYSQDDCNPPRRFFIADSWHLQADQMSQSMILLKQKEQESSSFVKSNSNSIPEQSYEYKGGGSDHNNSDDNDSENSFIII